MSTKPMLLSGEQVRAARAIARVEQADLARRCGLSVETIKRLERTRGPIDANSKTLRAIEEVFLTIGVAFDQADGGGRGVWLTNPVADPQSGSPSLSYMSERRGPPLHRLIYVSTVKSMSDRELVLALHDIVRASAPRNNALDVTGVLLACGGRFLQALEGGRDAVLQVYGAICTDRRHGDLHVVESKPLTARRFAERNLRAKLLQPDDPVFLNEPSMVGGFDPRALSSSVALDLLGLVAQSDAGGREAVSA